MKRRPRIEDLARQAGVSVATVDRVLNKRHPVREGTARRVLAAAEALGYHATGLLRHRLAEAPPQRTFGFLLQKRADFFYQALGAELTAATRASRAIEGRAVLEFVDELVPSLIAAKLRELGAKVDAMAVVAVDHPHVSAAIGELHDLGVPVFTLLSDLTAPARAGYLGIDSRKAGRTAAWTIARTARQPGKVGILVGSHRYLGQELAEISFRSFFREHAPDFRLLEPLFNLDEDRIAYEATVELLHNNPDLVGIYVAGGGMEGVIDALRDEMAGQRVVAVCNELIPETRAALIEGLIDLVISTPLPLLAAKTVEAMAAALSGAESDGLRQIEIQAELYISENL
jgi:LacI family transcriptional regulator